MEKKIPVVVIKELGETEKILSALRNYGIHCAEITFRTACAEEAIRLACKTFPDMEIGAAYPCPCEYGESSNPTDFTTLMEEKFKKAGYKMPTLVYWNVEARQDTFHAEQNDNVRFVSGQSASTFKTLCEDCDSFDAVALMLRVLDGERYGGVR